MIGLVVFCHPCAVAVFARVVAPHSPFEQYRDVVLLPPAWLEGGNWSYPLGTDPVGRDILSRLIYGSQFSLFIGLVVTTLSADGASRSASSPAISAAGRYGDHAPHGYHPGLSRRCCWRLFWSPSSGRD